MSNFVTAVIALLIVVAAGHYVFGLYKHYQDQGGEGAFQNFIDDLRN